MHSENKTKNKFIEKEIRLGLTRDRESGGGRQKVQSSNYKTNKCQGCNTQHDNYTVVNTAA